MNVKMHSAAAAAAVGNGAGGVSSGEHHARAYGGDSFVASLQARVRFREQRQRGAVVTSGVPLPRVRQILASVLALDPFRLVTAEVLRVDVHRPDNGRYQHDYGLSLAVAMAASLSRKTLGESLLFLGDVDLRGRIRDVAAEKVDQLNSAICNFEIETPLNVVCAPGTATWINASSTVGVFAAGSLADVTAAVWPGVELIPR